MFLVNFYRSTIGKKIIMAITGLIGIGFVIVHMVGNLQAFIGSAKLNAYAHFLHGPAAELVWAMRIVLIVAVILHVLMAYQLTVRARNARPVDYKQRKPQVSTLGSRTMRWGGVFLLLFIVFHILHFTTGSIDPAGAFGLVGDEGRDVYGNLVASFHIWWVVLLYVVAMIFLGLHLYHGAWSSVRTLGFATPSKHPLRRQIALVITFVVWLGFTLVPLGVVAGIIR
jgi:succinate dehydrogenase / fumarate reductase cytochrome b subunit